MARRSKAERKSKRKERVKKALKLVKKAALAPAKAAVFAALIPFKVMMQKILKEKGQTPKKKMSELVRQFYEVVVKGQSNYDESEHLGVEDLKFVVDTVKNWIQKIRDKKASGKPLSEQEEKIVATADAVQEAAIQEGKDIAEEKVGETVTNPKILLGFGAAAVVAIYFLTRKK